MKAETLTPGLLTLRYAKPAADVANVLYMLVSGFQLWSLTPN